MTDENALVQILEREGVIEYLRSRKESLWEMFCALLHAHQMFPGEDPKKENCIEGEIICPLVWDLLCWATKIQNVFVTNTQFDIEELEHYGGPVSRAIVKEVFRILDLELCIRASNKKVE
jgi:hypothetical protein